MPNLPRPSLASSPKPIGTDRLGKMRLKEHVEGNWAAHAFVAGSRALAYS